MYKPPQKLKNSKGEDLDVTVDTAGETTDGLWNKVSAHVTWIRKQAEKLGEKLEECGVPKVDGKLSFGDDGDGSGDSESKESTTETESKESTTETESKESTKETESKESTTEKKSGDESTTDCYLGGRADEAWPLGSILHPTEDSSNAVGLG